MNLDTASPYAFAPHEIVSYSAEETIAAGRAFAAWLSPGDLVSLNGPMGAGKTYFSKGVALGLSAATADEVTSPTYDLAHVFEGRRRLVHMDLHRIDIPSDEDLDWAAELLGEESIGVIEWGDRIAADLRARFYLVRITLDAIDGEEAPRRIRISRIESDA